MPTLENGSTMENTIWKWYTKLYFEQLFEKESLKLSSGERGTLNKGMVNNTHMEQHAFIVLYCCFLMDVSFVAQ